MKGSIICLQTNSHDMEGTWSLSSQKYFGGKMTAILLNWCPSMEVQKMNLIGHSNWVLISGFKKQLSMEDGGVNMDNPYAAGYYIIKYLGKTFQIEDICYFEEWIEQGEHICDAGVHFNKQQSARESALEHTFF
jgi:hypothetical protein